jgi:hydroxymethylpyrimidine/phosphomethylpyrimidine kinase
MGEQNSRRSPAFPKLQRGRQSVGTVPIALTIAGSDSSAGAGIQADLKTFSGLGVYGLTAVTCVVAEIPGKVSRIEQVSARMVRDQIEVLVKDFQIGAIKTGLLCSAEIVSVVAKAMRGVESLRGRRVPLVVDPVMIASSGDRLLEATAIDAYTDQLFPLATLITPNLDEAALLIGTEITGRAQMEKATKALASKYRAAILLKGGHLRGDNAIDLLFHKNKLTEFSARFVRGVSTHGTGCTYSAAITAGLACGLPLEGAIRQAKKFVTKSIVRRFRWKGESGEIVALNQSI